MAYLKFELDDGTIVYIESAEIPKGASGLIPGTPHVTDQSAISFGKSVETIRKMAVALIDNLRSGFAEQPDEISVSFGLKASADVGNLVVSRGGMEANYNVSLRWREDEKQEDEKKEPEGKGGGKEKKTAE